MNPDERKLALEVLAEVEWLIDYSAKLTEELVSEGRLVRLGVGEWAQAEGDARAGLFIVIQGSLHSYCAAPGDRSVLIGIVGPGMVIGHATRYSGGPRLVTGSSRSVTRTVCGMLQTANSGRAVRRGQRRRNTRPRQWNLTKIGRGQAGGIAEAMRQIGIGALAKPVKAGNCNSELHFYRRGSHDSPSLQPDRGAYRPLGHLDSALWRRTRDGEQRLQDRRDRRLVA